MELFAQAQRSWSRMLIVCDGPDCTYEKLIELANGVINVLIALATIIATVVLIYAGFKLLTSGGNENEAKEAKEMLLKVVWGFFWILVAWVAVYTIMNTLLKDAVNTIVR